MKCILLIEYRPEGAFVWVPPLGRELVLQPTGTVVALRDLTWSAAANRYFLPRENPDLYAVEIDEQPPRTPAPGARNRKPPAGAEPAP